MPSSSTMANDLSAVVDLLTPVDTESGRRRFTYVGLMRWPSNRVREHNGYRDRGTNFTVDRPSAMGKWCAWSACCRCNRLTHLRGSSTAASFGVVCPAASKLESPSRVRNARHQCGCIPPTTSWPSSCMSVRFQQLADPSSACLYEFQARAR